MKYPEITVDFVIQREAVQGRKDGPIIRLHCSGLGNRQLFGSPNQHEGKGAGCWCTFLLAVHFSSPSGSPHLLARG